LKPCAVIAILILTILSPLGTIAAGNLVEQSVFSVSVTSSAPLPSQMIENAEQEASRLFRDPGIRVAWLNCRSDDVEDIYQRQCRQVSFPSHLHLSILPSSKGLPSSFVGIAFLETRGQGCYADLFGDALERLRDETNISGAIILGHAMAHELGHLLLGANSHTSAGLMRAHWDRDDLAAAAHGGLRFSHEQLSRILKCLRDESTKQTSQPPLREWGKEATGADRTKIESEL
jgi:hypothetical protein